MDINTDGKLPLLRGHRGDIYQYNGMDGDKFSFTNLSQNRTASFDEKDCVFLKDIPYDLNMVAADFPAILYMIKTLELKF